MIFSSKTMNLNIKDAVGFLTFKKLEDIKFANHAFSTRLGGVSSGPFATLNLSRKSKDNPDNIEENLKRICNAANFPRESLYFLNQNHTSNVKVVKSNDHDSNIYDGSITNVKGITLVTSHADCAPIFFLDPVTKSIGLAHAGWRGTVSNIAGKMVSKMQAEYGSSPKDIICAIGPCIHNCCFEIQDDIISYFTKIDKNLVEFKNNKIYANIPECNKINLLNSGISDSNIIISDLCTKCNHDLFFSHRKQGKDRGGLMGLLYLA